MEITNIKNDDNYNLNKENNNSNNNINNHKNNENDNENNKVKDENNEIHNIIINDNNNNINDENNCIIMNENNNIINEQINLNKNNEEKINRIKSLINNSLSIADNKHLQEAPFLESNYTKFENMKNKVSEQKDILIDEYNSTDKSKLYLFSPVSLLINNIKMQFEKNDFEIFNISILPFILSTLVFTMSSFICFSL